MAKLIFNTTSDLIRPLQYWILFFECNHFWLKNGYLRLFWVQNYGVAIDNLAGEISVLDGYYIPTRYPNGLPDGIPAQVYNRKSAEDALQLAEKTVEFAKKLLLSDS